MLRKVNMKKSDTSSYLAIDQGPIVRMIENHRSGRCWKMFMANPEIPNMLRTIRRGIGKDEGCSHISHVNQWI